MSVLIQLHEWGDQSCFGHRLSLSSTAVLCFIQTHGSKVLMEMLAEICQLDAIRENMTQYRQGIKRSLGHLQASLGSVSPTQCRVKFCIYMTTCDGCYRVSGARICTALYPGPCFW